MGTKAAIQEQLSLGAALRRKIEGGGQGGAQDSDRWGGGAREEGRGGGRALGREGWWVGGRREGRGGAGKTLKPATSKTPKPRGGEGRCRGGGTGHGPGHMDVPHPDLMLDVPHPDLVC